MNRASHIQTKGKRGLSAPQRNKPYLVSSSNIQNKTSNLTPKKTKNTSALKRSKTPPKSSEMRQQKQVSRVFLQFLQIINDNKLLSKMQHEDIDKKAAQVQVYAKKIERIPDLTKQQRSEAPAQFWTQWYTIVDLYSDQLKKLQVQTTQKLRAKYESATQIFDTLEIDLKTAPPLLRSCINKFNDAADIIEKELDTKTPDVDIKKAIGFLNEINSNIVRFAELKNATKPVGELTQSALDYSMTKVKFKEFNKQKETTEASLHELVYEPNEIHQRREQYLQEQQNDESRLDYFPSAPRSSKDQLFDTPPKQNSPSPKKQNDSPYKDFNNQQKTIGTGDLREAQKLMNDNEEKKKKIRQAKDERRQTQKDLDAAKDANARNALQHQSAIRALKQKRQKLDKAKMNIEDVKAEIEELTKYRDELKQSVDRMTQKSRRSKKDKRHEQTADEQAQEENKKLTEDLTKARAEKNTLEEEWLRMKAIGKVLRSNMPQQTAKPYIENDQLRDEFIRISRKHLDLVESSLRQNYSNDRARLLGEMETDKKLQISYHNAALSNQYIKQDVQRLKEQRDQLQETLENSIFERYTTQAEYAHKARQPQKGNVPNSMLISNPSEQKLLSELEQVKKVYAQKKQQYLKEVQQKQNTSIQNMITKTHNEISDLRSAAYDDISARQQELKKLHDEYDSLKNCIEMCNRNGKPIVVFKGQQLSYDDANDRMENLINQYRQKKKESQLIATEEAKQELEILTRSSQEFENNAKRMIAWTEELYSTLLQTQAKVETLRIQEDILKQKLEDPSLDVDKCLQSKLITFSEIGNKSKETLNRVKICLKNLLTTLGIKGGDSMTPEEMMEAVDNKLKERQTK